MNQLSELLGWLNSQHDQVARAAAGYFFPPPRYRLYFNLSGKRECQVGSRWPDAVACLSSTGQIAGLVEAEVSDSTNAEESGQWAELAALNVSPTYLVVPESRAALVRFALRGVLPQIIVVGYTIDSTGQFRFSLQ